MEAANAGDRDALTALLNELAKPLRVHVAGNIDAKWQALLDVDDVLQITYLDAFSGINKASLDTPKDMLNWLYRLADNNIRDAIRGLSAAKRPNPSNRVTADDHDSASLDLLESLGVHSATPSRVAAAKEAKTLLRNALADLAPDHREVITRFDLKHEDPKEIANSLNRSVGAIYMLRARALERLSEVLPKYSS